MAFDEIILKQQSFRLGVRNSRFIILVRALGKFLLKYDETRFFKSFALPT
jgi:hypothetical protein